MEIQYFKYFVAVAEQSSFAKGAAACHVSQPALSTQIKKMEELLGCELFHRTKRSVQLSREGEALLPTARKILADVEHFQNSASQVGNPFAGRLNVGLSPLIAQSHSFHLLNKLKEQHPEISFHFLEETTGHLIQKLKNKEVDIILLPNTSALNTPLFSTQVVDCDELVYCFPKGRRKDFKKLPFIGSHGHCGLWDTMKSASAKLNFKPATTYKAHHVDMIKRWVQMGMGWSLIPKRSLQNKDTAAIETKSPQKKTYIEYVGVMLKGDRSDKVMGELARLKRVVKSTVN